MATKTAAASNIRFKATLHRPAEREKGEAWTFLVLPKAASSKLPSRSMSSVEGTLNDAPFAATLEPDGQGSHWLKVDEKLRKAAKVEPGDKVELEIHPAEQEPEPEVPDDLQQALANAPDARAVWDDITAVARRDWIHWITSPKKPETRVRRVEVTCDKLASGQRRACCFDRSGMYSKAFAAPEAAD